MKMSNFVQLIGYLGNDVEIFKKEDSKSFGKVSLATDASYKNKKGERVVNTEWHKLVMYGATADLAAKFIKKGSNVLVTGSIRTRSYESKDKVIKYTTEIVVEDIIFLDKK